MQWLAAVAGVAGPLLLAAVVSDNRHLALDPAVRGAGSPPVSAAS